MDVSWVLNFCLLDHERTAESVRVTEKEVMPRSGDTNEANDAL